MPNPASETIIYPFTTFNFSVEINKSGESDLLCAAAFAECDGLEMTMDVKTIREGGNNGKQIRLTGAFNYGQVTLKRGMTANFDLWEWVTATLTNPSLRADTQIVHLNGTAATVRYPPHRDAVGVRDIGISAQRVLPHQPARQVDVDVRTRMPARQSLADQGQRDDVLVMGDHVAVHDAQRQSAVQLAGQ